MALFLTAAMGLSLSSSLVSYAAAVMSDPALCDHHPAHTELCGYAEGTAETPCGHQHDGSCGYAAAVPETPCDKDCPDTDGDGAADHAADCAYQPAEPESPCTHTHDGTCGYLPAGEGAPCQFVCPICHPEGYSMDAGVSILLPEDEANLLTAGAKADLLDGVELSVEAADISPDDYDIEVFSIADSEGTPVDPDRYLIPEEGHSYLLVYAAYDAEGDLAAAAERAVTAAKAETLAGDPTPAFNSKAEALKALAETYQIYPGTVDADTGAWTVYDTGNESTASIKATVTLPESTEVEPNNFLYIREVTEGDPYYPASSELEAKAGKCNDMQCYAIHWVKVYEKADDQWTYEVQTDSVLGEADNAPTAKVEIKYLKTDAYLKGAQAHRKLMVFNSRQADGTHLEDASTPIDVTATDTAYTGFTFETNRAGPYVFVSKYLFEGYVTSITLSSDTGITDGVSPFDANNDPGNDAGDHNGIVRSYDSIVYDFIVNFGARSNVSTTTEGTVGFEMTLDADITEAVFDPASMTWMLAGEYTLEYLDEYGNVVLTRRSDGKYYDTNNMEVSPNDLASGSDESENSYTTSITSQRLRGSVPVKDANNIISRNQELKTIIQVLGADNEQIIQPTVRAWFVGNEDNYGSESTDGSGVQLAQPVETNTCTPDPVTVSAAARFNLELAKNANVSYKGWFDSSRGKEISEANTDSYTINGKNVTGEQLYTLLEQLAALEENTGESDPAEFTDTGGKCSAYLNGLSLEQYKGVFQNIRYGRITGYGITLQVYNDAASDGTNSKGFKGVSLPQGDITFDLALSATAGGTTNKDYYAQLWEYNENVSASSGNQNKNMYWGDLASTQYAAWAAPHNSGTGESSCYNGGAWKLDSDESDEGYHFTVSKYDFNLLNTGLQFPTHRAGNSSATPGYNTYIGSFSAGYVQVLNVFPRYQETTLNMDTQVTVKNLAVETTDGQGIAPLEGDSTGYAHETNQGDNTLSDDIPLYARGGMTKANAFCSANAFNIANKNASFTSYFLGTDFWGTSYDCSAFAGQDITLVGAARINAGDYKIRHMNMLQLFDSEALSIDTSKESPYAATNVTGATLGDVTILYAVDPDHPEGYDTNNKEIMAYMSTVREEDLVYFESLDKITEGYTCVGVLAELRKCSISGEGGYSTVLKIPMKVSEKEEFLRETVGTVNTVRIWTNLNDMGGGTVSWKNGTNNLNMGADDKNFVEDYSTVPNANSEHYSGQVANGTGKDSYAKTEYEKGNFVLGTNTGGYVYGSSLLILGYKAHVDIEVDNAGGESGGTPYYSMDGGQYTVEYRLKEIIANVDAIGRTQAKTTDLTLLSKLDTAREGDTAEQRIAIASGSYCMVPASDKMTLTDADGNPMEEQSVEISSNASEPTTVYYTLNDDSGEPKQYKIQVYAEPDTNGSQVTFHLSGVTVGVSVPDITYDAFIAPEAVEDGHRIQASAYISGTDDVRAYRETEGNMDNVTIGIVKLTATGLVKKVDYKYIELDGMINYTVTYTNNGSNEVNLYLYDLLPIRGDIRGSDFSGEMVLRDISAELRGDSGFSAEIQFYYSKTPYKDLYDMVKVFGEEGSTLNTDYDGRKQNINKMLTESDDFSPLGTISSANNHEFQSAFQEALENGTMTPEDITQEMEKMTGIYAVVTNLGGGKSLSITLTIESEDNKTRDLYRNIANSWLGDGTEPLTSNMVETTVLSRAVSGVVWEDLNRDGARQNTEPRLPNVTATLFQLVKGKDGNLDRYVAVTGGQGPNGRNITAGNQAVDEGSIVQMTTGANGAYSFGNLAAGDYIVAFSGPGLAQFKGSTEWQKTGVGSGVNSDGAAKQDSLALYNTDGSTEFTGFQYYIQYRADSAAVALHTIEEIVGGNITLTNDVELYPNLDLGLVTDHYELPETGGAGTFFWTAGGLTLVWASLSLAWIRRKKYQMWI